MRVPPSPSSVAEECVIRISGGVTTSSIYDGGRVILKVQSGTYTGTYTYGVSLIRRNGESFQYDGLGSARTFTNASGVVTAAATYDGYGNTVATSGSPPPPPSSEPLLTTATTGAWGLCRLVLDTTTRLLEAF